MRNFAYGDKFAAFLYDAVLLYAIALNETMTKDWTAMSLWTGRRLGLRDCTVSRCGAMTKDWQ